MNPYLSYTSFVLAHRIQIFKDNSVFLLSTPLEQTVNALMLFRDTLAIL